MIQSAKPARRRPQPTTPSAPKARGHVYVFVGRNVDQAILIAHEESRTPTTIVHPEWEVVFAAAPHVDTCFVLGDDLDAAGLQAGYDHYALVPGRATVIFAPPATHIDEVSERANLLGLPTMTLLATETEDVVIEILTRTGVFS